MKHFEINEWADFARGVASMRLRQAMEVHLAGGCAKCQRLSSLLRRVAATAAQESQYEIPRHAEAQVRSLFVLQRPEKVRSLPRLLARMVYDSSREPLPAGVRSLQRFSQQALYHAGDFSLDLRLEHQQGARHVSLVGQIANRKQPEARLANVPVFLMRGKEIVSRATSNRFGEFQMEYEPRGRVRLYAAVAVNGGRRIEVPLAGPMAGQPGESGFRKLGRLARRKRK